MLFDRLFFLISRDFCEGRQSPERGQIGIVRRRATLETNRDLTTARRQSFVESTKGLVHKKTGVTVFEVAEVNKCTFDGKTFSCRKKCPNKTLWPINEAHYSWHFLARRLVRVLGGSTVLLNSSKHP